MPFYSQILDKNIIVDYYISINENEETVVSANVVTKEENLEITFSYEGKNEKLLISNETKEKPKTHKMIVETKGILAISVNVIYKQALEEDFSNESTSNITRTINLNIGERLEYLKNKGSK